MRKIVAVLSLALLLVGCAGTRTTIGFGDFVKAVTTTVDNPISGVDIYRVKNTYAAAGELVVEWRRYCWSAPYATLIKDPLARPVCSGRRETLRIIQSADNKAFAAIAAADRFVAENPTLNAASAISAAWQAVTTFQSAIPAKRG